MTTEVARKSESSLAHWLGAIHQGDCVEQLSVVPADSVDLVFADPPFNIGYEYDEYDDRLDSDRYLEWSRLWMEQVRRVLSPAGTFWLAIGDEYAAELKIAAQQLGFHCRSWVSWYYTFGVHCVQKFTRSHAHLFHFVKDPKHFVFNAHAVKVPSARQLVYNDARAASGGRMPDDTWILRPQDCVDGLQPDEDTWYFPRVAGTFKERAGFHGCQMPEQLLGRIIKVSSQEGQVVVDPFSGSATTLVVAKKLGRQFFGIELSADYVQRGMRRLERAAVGDRLDGAEEPKVSAPQTNEKQKKSVQLPLFGFHSVGVTRAGKYHDAGPLLQAFANVCRGFSVDRVVVDPIFNAEFQRECDRLSVAGSAAERNRILFQVRSAGHLQRCDIVTSNRTDFTWRELDQYIFAAEIAWRQVADRYVVTLDELFCDERLASCFDQIAARFAPGFTSLEYRWAALKLRKEATLAVGRAKRFRRKLKLNPWTNGTAYREFNVESLPDGPGVYGIARQGLESRFLYVGETTRLRKRLLTHLDKETQRDQWLCSPDDLVIYTTITETIDDYPLARQILLAQSHKPGWNISSLLTR